MGADPADLALPAEFLPLGRPRPRFGGGSEELLELLESLLVVGIPLPEVLLLVLYHVRIGSISG